VLAYCAVFVVTEHLAEWLTGSDAHLGASASLHDG
jgi:hypothetical protein